jgi:hypothetical protein
LALEAALRGADQQLRNMPHGDNCYLTDDPPEYNRCYCGKESILSHIEELLPDSAPETPGKQFAPIGEGTICSNCTKTIGYHYQTAEGNLFCEVPKETTAEPHCHWDDDPDGGFMHYWRTACGNHGSRHGYKVIPAICPHCERPVDNSSSNRSAK